MADDAQKVDMKAWIETMTSSVFFFQFGQLSVHVSRCLHALVIQHTRIIWVARWERRQIKCTMSLQQVLVMCVTLLTARRTSLRTDILHVYHVGLLHDAVKCSSAFQDSRAIALSGPRDIFISTLMRRGRALFPSPVPRPYRLPQTNEERAAGQGCTPNEAD